MWAKGALPSSSDLPWSLLPLTWSLPTMDGAGMTNNQVLNLAGVIKSRL